MPVAAPIDRLTHEVLRTAVLHHKEVERRHDFPVVAHAGLPGRVVRHACSPHERLDDALRADLALAMVDQAMRSDPRCFFWITRPGALAVRSEDLAWHRAVSWAAAAAERPIALVVVTRRGWFDPVSGLVREWVRLRRHSCDPTWEQPGVR